ncbi:hypothetical protein J3Q64DRAFT_1848245 [Phycomyces blakesleeanus]|uniref:F-box domain-containing protein n=2 Tax=Phycomyces blakesleeanus TaxID=4837 RepID=A0A167LPL8_PHYB8|nr:hypothetical protein PHYBLDRAFT_148076 [Phycomyces blakesleeanus NRRL 1555(-)]OAD70857.1 hypothetical protein PHYBLDRAFT_148076 [Phycomyces blakesleeanus NRRL 1555(-)]|eukprot:XP_018288897.1 hypothetical protein PHYBLDRAFT_148076 [Phycomyces blakesleeanus NRRL 1555(-)]
MLASELPIEITLFIARFLQSADKIQCCLVCKAWTPAFQQSLFEAVIIKRYSGANKLVDSTNLANNLLQRYGHKTQTPEISKSTFLGDHQLYALQKYLPNIQYFKWSSKEIKLLLLTDFNGWNLWAESLTDLEITVKDYGYDILPKILDSIRSNLHRLKRLHFEGLNYDSFSPCTFDDFELLNDQLPELTKLLLTVQFDKMSPDELLKVKEINPRPYLKTLGMFIEKNTYEWLYYIAVKYPNISSLKLLSFTESTISFQTYQASQMLAKLSCPFQHLEKLTVEVGSTSEQTYLDFVNRLGLFNVPIKEIDLTIYNSLSFNVSNKDILQSIKIFANTLEKLRIVYFISSYYSGFSDELVYCPRLVDLTIEIQGTTTMLDVLLEQYPSLKNLSISSGDLTLRPDLTILSIEHGLSHFSLKDSFITASTLNYISICCKKLSTMRLKFVNIKGPQQGNTGDNCIDMSSTHFTKLNIKGIQFFDSFNRVQIALFVLSSSVAPIKNTWVYSIPDALINNGSSQLITRKLNEEESKEAEKYFCNFAGSVCPEDTKEQVDEYIKSLSENDWRPVLPKGYSTFKYGSLKTLLFDGEHKE